MKRPREEESDDEIFERRRKVHKQEKDAKEEIEDLFEEASSENSVEERNEEIEGWGMSGGKAAGILLEIFGDGTEYLDVLEHYSKLYSHENTESQKEKEEKEPETLSQIDREEIASKVAEGLLKVAPSFPKKDIEEMAGNIVEDKSLVQVITESFHCLDEPRRHMLVLYAKKLAELYKEKDKVLEKVPKILDAKVKRVIACAHTLETMEEYTRLIQYVYTLQSGACTDSDRQMAADITQKIADVSIEHTEHGLENGEEQKIRTPPMDKHGSTEEKEIDTETRKERKGLLYNPWMFRTAVEVGMNISTIEIQGKGAPIEILASKIAEKDMFILESLKKRGVSYKISLNKEETVKRILEKLRGTAYTEEALREAIFYFIEKSSEDIIQGIKKELSQVAEEDVKILLFRKVVEILSVKPGKEDILGVWIDKGKIRYHKTDYKGASISSGIVQGIDGLNLDAHQGIIAITGKGYKLKQFMKYKNKMYIDASLLELIEETKDLPNLLCRIVRSPLVYAENVMKADKHLPALIPLQRQLHPSVAMGVFDYAVAYKKAEEHVTSSYSYVHLKKELLVFMKSGGDLEGLFIDRYAKCDEIRSTLKEASVPHTGWVEKDHPPVIENVLLKMAYGHCIKKIKNQTEIAGMTMIDQVDRFLIFNDTIEDELLSLQMQWMLSSGKKIYMDGKVMEGDITCINSSETHIRLENGISAVLEQKKREGLMNGQRLRVQIVEVDMMNSRAVVREEGAHDKSQLRAKSHWRVKALTGKEAFRMLRDKSFGSFVLRLSPKFPESVILSIRITESPEKCLCAHIRINEVGNGYEIEGKIFKTLEILLETYVVNYLKSLRRVIDHRKFTTEPVEAIKQRLIRSKQGSIKEKYALSISKTDPGNVSFIYMPRQDEATEILLRVVERGLYYNGEVYTKPDSFVDSLEREESSFS